MEGEPWQRPPDVAKRLRELEQWGVDLGLIDASLARSPRERLDLMLGRLELIEALQRGRREPNSP